VLLGRVIGNVVCTMKDASLVGQKLLIVQPLDRKGRDTGRPIVALDSVGAGAARRSIGAAARKPASHFSPPNHPPKPRLWALWIP